MPSRKKTSTTSTNAALRRPAGNVLSAIAGAQWAITRDSLETIYSVAARQNLSIEALEAMRGEELDNAYDVSVRDGVATMPVRGPLFRYASFFTRVSGATSYEDLARDFKAAIDNPAIKAIILNLDSPGGEVNGVAEFARQVFDARGTKPIIAYVSNMAASAGYWIAAACDEIVTAPTALIGSIGTIMGTEIVKRNDETVEEYVLVSSQSPRKNIDIRTEDGQAEIQVVLDALADVFIGDVAEFRDTSVDDVLSNFGEGGVFVGEAAIEPGLADRLGNYEDLHAELSGAAGNSATLPLGGGASPSTSGDSMAKQSTTATPRAGRRSAAPVPDAKAPDAASKADEKNNADAGDDKEDEEDGGADDVAEDKDGKKIDGKKKAKAASDTADDSDEEDDEGDEPKAGASVSAIEQATKAERARIAAINALPGAAALKQHCIDEGMSAEASERLLAAAGGTVPANRLAAMKKDDAGAHASATANTSTTTTTSPRDAAKASVDRFYSLTKPAKGATTRTP